jgi:allophanate hydrolase
MNVRRYRRETHSSPRCVRRLFIVDNMQARSETAPPPRPTVHSGSLAPTELTARYVARTLTVAEAVAAVYERIDLHDGVWIFVVPVEDALRRATELDALADRLAAGEPLPPLFGLPFAVKDNIDVAGLPTTAACPDFSYIPGESAPLVERLVEAGAIVIGKTNLDQFATGLTGARSPYGIPRSPFNPDWISGGSSSGSAVAVALDQVSFAIGTDTAGSGRVPAALTATVGLKPSRGLVSTRGIVPACRSLDCPSVHAPTVADATRVLAVVAGPDPGDPYSRLLPLPPARPAEVALRGLRLAVPSPGQAFEADAWFTPAVGRLEAAGVTLVPVDLSDFFEAGGLLYGGGWLAERYGGLADFLADHPGATLPVIDEVLARGPQVTGADVFDAQHRLADLARRTAPIWAGVDAMLVPTVPRSWPVDEVLADPIGLNARLGRFTTFGNLLDLCGLAVPAGFDGDGMPLGVSVLAPAGADAGVAAIAAAVGDALTGTSQRTVGTAPPEKARPSHVRLAVVGAHLSGQPLHGQLQAQGAVFVARTTTAAEYRLYALPGEPPRRPGLLHTPDRGAAVEVEVYTLPVAGLGAVLAAVAPPLTIGSVLLIDGNRVAGFLCESSAVSGAVDITTYGGWRAYLDRV